MKKKLLLMLSLLLVGSVVVPATIDAQEETEGVDQYQTGVVTRIVQETQQMVEGKQLFTQLIRLVLPDQSEINVEHGSEMQPINADQRLIIDEQIVVRIPADAETPPNVVDFYRIPMLLVLLGLFAVVVVAVGGKQGIFSFLGMAMSIAVLMLYIVPQILAGNSPLWVSLSGCFLIAISSVYVSHGWGWKSHLSLVSITSGLLIVAILSYLAVKSSRLMGLGSEEAYFLQFGQTSQINLQGLLLGGMMLGALGVLDDVVVSQVSVVFQLKNADKQLSFFQLFRRAITVGKDHVASMVNTLVLAYAGANMPLFLLFVLNEETPHWVTVNSEMIAEEIIRTLTGSIGLVLTVPIATFVASYFAVRAKKLPKTAVHSH